MEIRVNNKQIGYYKFGDGQKMMVMIPGIGTKSCISFGKSVENAYKLFKDDFTVYLIERANVLNDNDDIDNIADDYIGVIETLGLNDIYLYGASYGGMISQRIVLKRPDLVKKMVFVSSDSGRCETSKETIKRWYDLAKDKKFKELSDGFIDYVYSEKMAIFFKEMFKKDPQVLTDDEIQRFLIQIKTILNFNGFEELKNIKCPTLILAAKGDKIFSYKEAELMNREINNSKLYIFGEECSHAIFDEVQEVKQMTYDFYME